MFKKRIYTFILILFIIGFFVCMYNIININMDNNSTNEIVKKIEKEVIVSKNVPLDTNEEDDKVIEDTILELNFDKLDKMNDDTVAWIKINNTSINYPIVQTNDNTYYLNHSFDKSSNANGWIFLNYKNTDNFSDQNTVIFGHNTNGSSMFSELKKIYNGKINSNLIIELYTRNFTYTYQVFSIYLSNPDDVIPISIYLSDNTLKEIIDKSKYSYNISVTKDDSILTLSTCHNITDNRIIMHAKKII